MPQKKERFIIIDGSSLLYRAFFALPLLSTPDGIYTNAILGFSRMLMRLFTDFKPDLAAIAFDKSRHTFRTDIYESYKGTREKTPDELKGQIPLLKNLAQAAGIKFLESDGYEADDIIGTLSTQAAAKNYDTLVITGDRDALQLIRPNLRVIFTKKGISDIACFDEEAFKEAYSLSPIKLIDLKALMGDKSDNIPGIFGIGEKTALKLLTEYGSLDGLYENIEKIKAAKLKEKLKNGKDDAYLSYKLATIDCHMPLTFIADDFTITPDDEKLTAFCQSYGLKSLKKVLFMALCGEKKAEKKAGNPASDCTLIEATKEDIKKIAQISQETGLIFLPLTTGKIPHKKCLGLAVQAKDKAYFLDFSRNENEIKALLENATLSKITFNLKESLACNLAINGKITDLLLLGYMLEPSDGDYTPASLAEKYLLSPLPETPKKISQKELCGFWLNAIPLEKLALFMCEKMKKENLLSLYEELELPLAGMLVNMERAGVHINQDRLAEMAQNIGQTIDTLFEEIYQLAGCQFNVNSPKQLGAVLFEKLGLPAQKKTKTGYSTNAAVLDNLRYAHPVVGKILDYRMWSKLKSTYLDGMATLIEPQTSRIHTTFNQTATATGRLSSSEPNLQNIPVRTEAGKKIRSLFVPGPGYKYFISADYSQIELRILAHMSGDENFISSFCANEDIHRRTASEIFGVAPEDVTNEQRRHAKAINFGLVYGKSDFGLAKELHISRQAAASYIESYFKKYAGVKRYLDQIVEKAHEDGYSTTLFGRRRHLATINSKNANLRAQAERMAMNTPIQGTAADIIKRAMLSAQKNIEKAQLKSRIVLQVHDELVIETAENEIEAVKKILKDSMQNAAQLKVPLTVDINMGTDWASAK